MKHSLLQPFGVSFEDINVSLLTPSSYLQLAGLISQHRVAVLRRQHLNNEQFTNFLRGFGELTFTKGETPVVGSPMLNVVSNIGRKTPPKSVFHTDTSYIQRPPSFSALLPVLLPENGGETLFSDQVNAVMRLPKKVLEFLKGRTVLHSVTQLDGQNTSTRQPLLRSHPITGEISLFLSTPARCTEISNIDSDLSVRILSALYRHSTRPRYCYRHAWKSGDIIIWDNRVSMHRADHSGVTQDRLLHRGMVEGEIPLLADFSA